MIPNLWKESNSAPSWISSKVVALIVSPKEHYTPLCYSIGRVSTLIAFTRFKDAS